MLLQVEEWESVLAYHYPSQWLAYHLFMTMALLPPYSEVCRDSRVVSGLTLSSGRTSVRDAIDSAKHFLYVIYDTDVATDNITYWKFVGK